MSPKACSFVPPAGSGWPEARDRNTGDCTSRLAGPRVATAPANTSSKPVPIRVARRRKVEVNRDLSIKNELLAGSVKQARAPAHIVAQVTIGQAGGHLGHE